MKRDEAFRQVDAGSSDEELRYLAKASGVDYDELWNARLAHMRRFERGVGANLSRRKRYS